MMYFETVASLLSFGITLISIVFLFIPPETLVFDILLLIGVITTTLGVILTIFGMEGK